MNGCGDGDSVTFIAIYPFLEHMHLKKCEQLHGIELVHVDGCTSITLKIFVQSQKFVF